MKRVLFLLTLICTVFSFSTFAQNASLTPEQEEKVKRLGTDVETLIAANAELQKKISALNEELARVREEMAKSGNESSIEALREDLKKLAETVREVDKKRVDDKEVVAGQLEELKKLLKSGLSAPPANRSSKPVKLDPPTNTAPTDKPTLEYVIKSGDTLGEIVNAANAQFKDQGRKKVTLQQVLDTNPGLKPERMQVGQKIFIPIPEK